MIDLQQLKEEILEITKEVCSTDPLYETHLDTDLMLALMSSHMVDYYASMAEYSELDRCKILLSVLTKNLTDNAILHVRLGGNTVIQAEEAIKKAMRR
jgi:hypothetical protein